MKKLIALLLSLCLMAGILPALAEEAQANDAVTVEDIFQAGLAAYEAEITQKRPLTMSWR